MLPASPRSVVVFVIALGAGAAVAQGQLEITYRAPAVSGMSIPGGEPALTPYCLLYPSINNSGHVAFLGDTTAENSHGIWSDADGTMRQYVNRHDQPPAAAPGTRYQTIDFPTINDQGQLLFLANTTEPPVFLHSGIWIADTNGVENVVYSGQPIPGGDAGEVFGDSHSCNAAILGTPAMNNNGQAGFFNCIEGTALGHSVWISDPSSHQLIARGHGCAGYRPFSGLIRSDRPVKPHCPRAE